MTLIRGLLVINASYYVTYLILPIATYIKLAVLLSIQAGIRNDAIY